MRRAIVLAALLAGCGGPDPVSWLEGEGTWELRCPCLSVPATIRVDAGGHAAVDYPPECELVELGPIK